MIEWPRAYSRTNMALQYSEKYKSIYCVQCAKPKNLLVSDSALMVRVFTAYWTAQNSGEPNTDKWRTEHKAEK